MAVGKRLRFEIFKRDGFKCVYCGATPMQSPLHVDHVDAVANGGSDEPYNLVTACEGCNLGKSDIPLDEKKFKAERVTEAHEDQAEQIRAYLAVQREVAKAKSLMVDEVIGYWTERIGEHPWELAAQLPAAISRNGLERVLEAIDITARKQIRSDRSRAQYFHGVLRKMRQMSEA